MRVPVMGYDKKMVPKGGLEPPWLAPHAPQTCVSTSSTTSALVKTCIRYDLERRLLLYYPRFLRGTRLLTSSLPPVSHSPE